MDGSGLGLVTLSPCWEEEILWAEQALAALCHSSSFPAAGQDSWPLSSLSHLLTLRWAKCQTCHSCHSIPCVLCPHTPSVLTISTGPGSPLHTTTCWRMLSSAPLCPRSFHVTNEFPSAPAPGLSWNVPPWLSWCPRTWHWHLSGAPLPAPISWCHLRGKHLQTN